ncbi:ATP-binding cassette domain-containing protein [Coralloluteibacterium stylophorae]|uniref:ATP-binding cassette domain-containing protein n=1 Tax=Coralloluteibacterium stylophorae TaxID=1776034 RepID=A0A8J7VYG3_9GAMM|nr:ATP-binding cassette domain-containing protein [Coralloluteibacterium stylophorae]
MDIDVELRRGAWQRRVRLAADARTLALTGPSGIGKTSLLYAVAGLLRPEAGHIEIGGQRLFDRARGIDLPPHRRRIGYVFQDARLFPHRDVRANLLYGQRRRGGRPAPGDEVFDLDEVVALLGIGELLARRPAGLSGGEAQRVAIGRALLSQPHVLLFDEPLSALDRARRAELLPWLRRVRDETRIPIVYVSHAPEEIAELTTEIHRLDDPPSA